MPDPMRYLGENIYRLIRDVAKAIDALDSGVLPTKENCNGSGGVFHFSVVNLNSPSGTPIEYLLSPKCKLMRRRAFQAATKTERLSMDEIKWWRTHHTQIRNQKAIRALLLSNISNNEKRQLLIKIQRFLLSWQYGYNCQEMEPRNPH